MDLSLVNKDDWSISQGLLLPPANFTNGVGGSLEGASMELYLNNAVLTIVIQTGFSSGLLFHIRCFPELPPSCIATGGNGHLGKDGDGSTEPGGKPTPVTFAEYYLACSPVTQNGHS